MKITANSTAEKSSHGASATLSVVALHHQDTPHSLLQEVMQHFTRLIGREIGVHTSYWAFHEIEEQECFTMASHAVQESSLIIIASSEGSPVPDPVQTLLDSGFMEQRSVRALIVAIEESVHSHADEVGALGTHAGNLASRLQANFMCCHDRGCHESRQFIASTIKCQLPELTTCSIHSDTEASGNNIENESAWNGISSLNPAVVSLTGEIQKLAYDLWLKDRRPYGKEQEFWFRAEKQILDQIASQEQAS